MVTDQKAISYVMRRLLNFTLSLFFFALESRNLSPCALVDRNGYFYIRSSSSEVGKEKLFLCENERIKRKKRSKKRFDYFISFIPLLPSVLSLHSFWYSPSTPVTSFDLHIPRLDHEKEVLSLNISFFPSKNLPAEILSVLEG